MAADVSTDERAALRITGSGLEMPVSGTTRAENDKWTAGDAIGVFSQTISTGAVDHDGRNVKYTAISDGDTQDGHHFYEFTPVGAPVYLTSDAVRIYAYYPYTDDASSGSFTNPAVSISVANQTSQPAIDWMTTGYTYYTLQGGTTPISAKDPTCQLLFKHSLTKLQFNLRHGTGMDKFDIIPYDDTADPVVGNAVKLDIAKTNGFYTTATLNLISAAVTDQGAQAALVPYEMPHADAKAYDFDGNGTVDSNELPERTFEAIVLPQAMTTGPVVTITIVSGTYKGTYYFTLPTPENNQFKAGYRYIYNVLVDATEILVTNTVTPWTTVTAPTQNIIY